MENVKLFRVRNILLAVLVLFLAGTMILAKTYYEHEREKTSDFSEGWMTQMGLAIDTDDINTTDFDGHVIITKQLPSKIENNDALCFIGLNAVFTLYIDDVPVYSYSGRKNFTGYGYGTDYNFINLSQEDAGATVKIEMTSAFKDETRGRIRMMSIEPATKYVYRITRAQFLPFVISAGIVAIGILMIIAGIVLPNRGEKLKLAMLGLNAVFIGMWLANDTGFYRLVVGGVRTSRNVDHAFLHLFLLPLLIYAYLLTKERKKLFLYLFCGFWIADITFFLVMRYGFDTDMADLTSFMALYYVASFATAIYMFASNAKFCRRNRISQNMRMFCLAFNVVGIMGFLDLFLYLAGERSVTGRGEFARLGFCVFFIVIGFDTFATYINQQATIRRERFINKMLQFGVSGNDPEVSIRAIIEYFGREFKADHAYIYENRHDGTFHNTYEWFREGAPEPNSMDYHDLPYEGLIDQLHDIFAKDHKLIIESDRLDGINPAVADIMRSYKLKQIVVGPLEYNGEVIGLFGIDDAPHEYGEEIADLIWLTSYFITGLLLRRNERRDLLRYSYTDSLTGCKNRRAMVEFEVGGKRKVPYGLLMCDINGLKIVNDSMGHEAGDALIIDVAQSLIDVFGADNVYRLGGDEFAAYAFPEDEAAFNEMVEKARSLIIAKGRSASIGAVFTADKNSSPKDIKEAADERMYEEKEDYYQGRNDRRTSKRPKTGQP